MTVSWVCRGPVADVRLLAPVLPVAGGRARPARRWARHLARRHGRSPRGSAAGGRTGHEHLGRDEVVAAAGGAVDPVGVVGRSGHARGADHAVPDPSGLVDQRVLRRARGSGWPRHRHRRSAASRWWRPASRGRSSTPAPTPPRWRRAGQVRPPRAPTPRSCAGFPGAGHAGLLRRSCPARADAQCLGHAARQVIATPRGCGPRHPARVAGPSPARAAVPLRVRPGGFRVRRGG